MTRYTLTDNKKTLYGIELTQIKAAIDLPQFNVKAGDLGGWIEKETNFPEFSKGWIFTNAIVMHGGVMHGGVMRGGVMHGGEMRAGVMWGGVMWGGVMWGGVHKKDSIFITGLRWPILINDDQITIGCQSWPILKWWKFKDATIAKMDTDALEFWNIYRPILKAMCDNTGRN
jgi:hypothetical protein